MIYVTYFRLPDVFPTVSNAIQPNKINAFNIWQQIVEYFWRNVNERFVTS